MHFISRSSLIYCSICAKWREKECKSTGHQSFWIHCISTCAESVLASYIKCNKLITSFFIFLIHTLFFLNLIFFTTLFFLSVFFVFFTSSRLIKIKYKIICLNCPYQHFLQKIKIPNHLQSFSRYFCILIVVVVVDVVFSCFFSPLIRYINMYLFCSTTKIF